MDSEYREKCYSIFRQLSETYPKHPFDYAMKAILSSGAIETLMCVRMVVPYGIMEFIIRNDTPWQEIKRGLDKRINNPRDDTCFICRNISENKYYCGECSNWICYDCILELVRKGKGTLKCPFCRKITKIRRDDQLINNATLAK